MNQRLVFIDLETGGTDPKRHPITQLAAIAIDHRGDVLEAFEAKLRFNQRTANASSLRKSHYHPGIWAKEANEVPDAARQFAGFLRRHATVPAMTADGKHYQVAQLVAHNAAFDAPFLIEWFERLNIYLPARRLVLCTLQLAMWQALAGRMPQPSNFQLATLCRYYGVPFHAATAHDALGDVTATVQLYQAMERENPRSGRQAA